MTSKLFSPGGNGMFGGFARGSGAPPVWSKWSMHFRSSTGGTGTGSPYSETSPSTYVQSTDNPYPITRNGITFGYSATGALASDYGSATSARISGRIAIASSITFRVDLPDGPGTYNVWFALGALTTATATAIAMFQSDGTTAIAAGTLAAQTPAINTVIDASGLNPSVASWLAGSVAVSITFTGSSFFIKRNGATSTYLASLEFQRTV